MFFMAHSGWVGGISMQGDWWVVGGSGVKRVRHEPRRIQPAGAGVGCVVRGCRLGVGALRPIARPAALGGGMGHLNSFHALGDGV